MSGGEGSEEGDTSCECCASCGIAELDDMKLVPCVGCDLVKYCSDECTENHKSQHEEDCKKRAAELRDELLFKQPESSHLGDCPICCLPLSLDRKKSAVLACCSKIVCNGCYYANGLRELRMRLALSCPFCRKSLTKTSEEVDQRHVERIEVNDPVALLQHGAEQDNKGNYRSAFHYYTRAAALGDAWAHYCLALLYQLGRGVDKEKGKHIQYLEEAAIGGHPNARFRLGVHEWNNGNIERAVKHWIIAATQGDDNSMEALMDAFKEGFVEKEEFAATLRAKKAAVDAMKSPQREEAEKVLEKWRKRA